MQDVQLGWKFVVAVLVVGRAKIHRAITVSANLVAFLYFFHFQHFKMWRWKMRNLDLCPILSIIILETAIARSYGRTLLLTASCCSCEIFICFKYMWKILYIKGAFLTQMLDILLQIVRMYAETASFFRLTEMWGFQGAKMHLVAKHPFKMPVISCNKIIICLPIVNRALKHISQLHSRCKYFSVLF